MAIKKSELYSKLWASCDALRGGMDASQYKDYVLFMLYIKYISDKYAGQEYAPIEIPAGATFADMVALKGKPDIGDRINKQIVAPLAAASKLPQTALPDFDSSEKLGNFNEKVERLGQLIGIFEDKKLDFSKNRSEGDDILGDAYEYLMRHFATESGKSKGQFYTPAEVSRVIAKIIGIGSAKTTAATTAYDPTCGSGSLLLKVAEEAQASISLYGQEKEVSNCALATMNMVLHNYPTAEIKQGNTLSNPRFPEEEGEMTQFDYVVANPPFSDKNWSIGVSTGNDPYKRFDGFGVPPEKNGDYAFLLHILRSLKSRGKGACILPHGVLFRGNAEADIRRNLIKRGYISGIIGLPANLFYGTGIPACIIVLDKEEAAARKGIFIIDAGKGFIKDGNKNRLREMDIHKIVDTFTRKHEIPRYSRMVSVTEIADNDFNLNIPRYIDSSEPEDIQNIEAHLLGDIPAADIEAMEEYWQVLPGIKKALLKKADRSKDFYSLKLPAEQIKEAIYNHAEFTGFIDQMNEVFALWQKATAKKLNALMPGFKPKELIVSLSDSLLNHYDNRPLLDKYDIYQHLMNYWDETMQDDCYQIAAAPDCGGGWVATIYRILEEKKNKDGSSGKIVDKGWTCDLIPKELVINRYFKDEQQEIDDLNEKLEYALAALAELEEEHGSEDGALAAVSKKADACTVFNDFMRLAWSSLDQSSYKSFQDLQKQKMVLEEKMAKLAAHPVLDSVKSGKGKITTKAIKDYLKNDPATTEVKTLNAYLECEREYKELKEQGMKLQVEADALIEEKLYSDEDGHYLAEIRIVQKYIYHNDEITKLKKEIKEAQEQLDAELLAFYPTLTEKQIKQLVVDDKWLARIDRDIHSEMDRISQRLTGRVRELAQRYEIALPELNKSVRDAEKAVEKHLRKMGLTW